MLSIASRCALLLAADPLPPPLHDDLAGLVAVEAARPGGPLFLLPRHRRGLGTGDQGPARQPDGADRRALGTSVSSKSEARNPKQNSNRKFQRSKPAWFRVSDFGFVSVSDFGFR